MYRKIRITSITRPKLCIRRMQRIFHFNWYELLEILEFPVFFVPSTKQRPGDSKDVRTIRAVQEAIESTRRILRCLAVIAPCPSAVADILLMSTSHEVYCTGRPLLSTWVGQTRPISICVPLSDAILRPSKRPYLFVNFIGYYSCRYRGQNGNLYCRVSIFCYE